MHRTALQRAAAVGVLPQSGFRVDFAFDIASELLWCGGASPTPQLQFQVLPRTSSSGKRRQSLSVSKLTAVTCKFEPYHIHGEVEPYHVYRSNLETNIRRDGRVPNIGKIWERMAEPKIRRLRPPALIPTSLNHEHHMNAVTTIDTMIKCHHRKPWPYTGINCRSRSCEARL